MSARPYSPASLAERWGCHQRTVRELIRRGDLKSFRVGALVRISAEEIGRYECATGLREPQRGSSSASGMTKQEIDTEARLHRLTSGRPSPTLVSSSDD